MGYEHPSPTPSDGPLSSSYRVGTFPTVYYVPAYVSEAEERQLLSEIRASKAKWTQVSNVPSECPLRYGTQRIDVR